MTEFASGQWERALGAYRAAWSYVEVDADSAASRAYYAVFHAVTALFALRGKQFKKHSALRAAVHRDLVHSGEWPEELGRSYSDLMDIREAGDYGEGPRVSVEDARIALAKARTILGAVNAAAPELFVLPELPEPE